MSKIADAIAALEPTAMGRPRKLDQLLDDEDKAAIVDRYKAGCSVKTIRIELNAALRQMGSADSITDNPIIGLLEAAGVYRSRV